MHIEAIESDQVDRLGGLHHGPSKQQVVRVPRVNCRQNGFVRADQHSQIVFAQENDTYESASNRLLRSSLRLEESFKHFCDKT